ncbi:phosphopantetheine-binding protein [Streptomyces luteireticuli]|uniref:Carrier domain-containing protein n=1 Tax=Streptomyces luteireticuli TaxID=173858 RepID=A0ABN0Z8B3_9ACTN
MDAREFVSRYLPAHMVPAVVMVSAEFLLSPTGKVDRRALPVSAFGASASRPRSPADVALCTLFADVLGVDEVGPDDGFFDLGGHSLMATSLVSRVQTALGAELGVSALFEAPTPAALARLIAGHTTEGGVCDVLLELRGHGSRHRCSAFIRPPGRVGPTLVCCTTSIRRRRCTDCRHRP